MEDLGGVSEHIYLSTACRHAVEPGREGLHDDCKTDATRWDGSHKVASKCKFCSSMCTCSCHVEDRVD